MENDMITLTTNPIARFFGQALWPFKKAKSKSIDDYLAYKLSIHDSMGETILPILAGIISKMHEAALKHSPNPRGAYQALSDTLTNMHYSGTLPTTAPDGIAIAVQELFNEIRIDLADDLRDVLHTASSNGILLEHLGDVPVRDAETGHVYEGWRFTFKLEKMHNDMERALGPCPALIFEVTDGNIPNWVRSMSIPNLCSLDTVDAERAKKCFNNYWAGAKEQLIREFA
jgi:hypothetical protein